MTERNNKKARTASREDRRRDGVESEHWQELQLERERPSSGGLTDLGGPGGQEQAELHTVGPLFDTRGSSAEIPRLMEFFED